MARTDLIVVSYNSAPFLRDCVAAFADHPDFDVYVVDNGSSDASLDTLVGLDIRAFPLDRNHGFAFANNVGLREGSSELVLFLNPDARISPHDVLRLAGTFEHTTVGAVGPKIVDAEGQLDFSQRRFPRVRSAFARALFVHHLFPRHPWSDDLVRDSSAYEAAHSVEWVSGACILARRDVIELVGMWDDDFFLYGEDIDLCKRIWDAGYEVRFEPGVEARHVGGASTPRTSLAPLLVESRLRFAHKHERPWAVGLVRVALALELVLRLLVGRGGRAARLGYVRAIPALFVPLRGSREASQREGGGGGTVSGAGAGSS